MWLCGPLDLLIFKRTVDGKIVVSLARCGGRYEKISVLFVVS
jgi:hypothetical protein